MAHVFTAPSNRIMFFINDPISFGSFVNIKNGATCQLEVKVMIEDEILSKVTSTEENEEDCEEDTNEIEDLI